MFHSRKPISQVKRLGIYSTTSKLESDAKVRHLDFHDLLLSTDLFSSVLSWSNYKINPHIKSVYFLLSRSPLTIFLVPELHTEYLITLNNSLLKKNALKAVKKPKMRILFLVLMNLVLNSKSNI